MAAGPAEKLKTRIVKTPEAGAAEKKARISAQKDNGRLRVRANDHYRTGTSNPPNPGALMKLRGNSATPCPTGLLYRLSPFGQLISAT
jgi:hypothetical protein